MSVFKAFLAEILRLIAGLGFVILLSIPSIQLLGEPGSVGYGYLCTAVMVFFALVWMFLLIILGNRSFSRQHHAASGLAVLMATGAFLVLVPLALDRSLSVHMLQEMQSISDNGASAEEIEGLFIRQYTCNHNAVGKRLAEQVIAGNVQRLENGSYALTTQGKAFTGTLNLLARSFAIPPRSAVCEGTKP